MRPERFQTLSSLCGITGVVLLVTSFVINPGPGPNPTTLELAAFGKSHHTTILLGAWLQAVSPFLIMTFALAAVRVAGAADRFPGQMMQVGFVVLVMVSLLEVVFYLGAVNGDPATTGLISLDLVHGTQHLFSMVAAPSVFFPFAVVILRTRVLPRAFGYTGLALGALFAMLGVFALFLPLQYIVDDLAFVQGVWWLLAATTLLLRTSTPGAAFPRSPAGVFAEPTPNPEIKTDADLILRHQSEEQMDQRVNEFFLRFERANSTDDVSEISGLYANTFMFGGPNGVRVVQKEDFLKVLPKMKAHFSSMGLSETQLQAMQANPLDSKYLLARVVWRMKLRNSSLNNHVDASATYVLVRGNGDALSIVLQIDHQDLASVIKEQQNTQQ